ncbi:hypothetical protein PUN28_013415 [Cardiocondyla obscurior]|uniref:Uncharacterized protein n=1 Tax=Cardiocondyla obscurior TaxID=286306 RepID=A0AAW2FAR4_9HYME
MFRGRRPTPTSFEMYNLITNRQAVEVHDDGLFQCASIDYLSIRYTEEARVRIQLRNICDGCQIRREPYVRARKRWHQKTQEPCNTRYTCSFYIYMHKYIYIDLYCETVCVYIYIFFFFSVLFASVPSASY